MGKVEITVRMLSITHFFLFHQQDKSKVAFYGQISFKHHYSNQKMKWKINENQKLKVFEWKAEWGLTYSLEINA